LSATTDTRKYKGRKYQNQHYFQNRSIHDRTPFIRETYLFKFTNNTYRTNIVLYLNKFT
jgi:hypothetical protein